MGILDFFKKKPGSERASSSYKYVDTGFHGDRYLLEVVEFLANNGTEIFIETGTNVATTLSFVAKKYPHLQCFSCEPDPVAFELATKHTAGFSNVMVFNLMSQDFIKMLKGSHPDLFKKKTIFWLDAHSHGFDWPLKEEVKFVVENFEKAYLMIDDFKVPGKEMFRYDSYKEQLCAHEFIVNEIGSRSYQLFYPGYIEKTSQHHPLQGWALYVFGENLNFPERLRSNVSEVK
ncbi:MAG: hypothetical protein M3R27_05525 [Bacteroidota bacterium]|nr:hypothetical protein [Bacteroidota bacterium]